MLTELMMADLGFWPSMAGAEARDFWREWSAQEFDFLQRQRPWERATVIVNGTPTQPYDQSTEIMLAPALY